MLTVHLLMALSLPSNEIVSTFAFTTSSALCLTASCLMMLSSPAFFPSTNSPVKFSTLCRERRSSEEKEPKA